MTDDRPSRRAGEPLRIGCVGGSFHSAVGRTHIAALRMDHRYEIVAGCFSRHAEENDISSLRYGVDAKRTYPSFEAMLDGEKGRIDAVAILTPTDQHVHQVLACLDGGLPVICEKALAVSSNEVEQIQERLDAKNGFLAVIFNYLGYPMLRELRAMIANGDLGAIQQIHIEMPQEGFARLGPNGQPMIPQAWRLRDHSCPTVSLDLGVHTHSIVSFLTGERPEKVVGSSGSFGNFAGIVDNVVSIAEYTNNLHCTFWFSKVALGARNGLKVRVYGDKASAEWVQEYPEYIQFAEATGRKSTIDRASGKMRVAQDERYCRFKAGHPAGFIEAFANYYFDVADALETYLIDKRVIDRQYVYGLAMANEGIRLMEAIATSSGEMRWVAF